MKMFFRLIGVETDQSVTNTTDCDFLFLIQRAALLALKDTEKLTETQQRQAEEALLLQYRKGFHTICTEANLND